MKNSLIRFLRGLSLRQRFFVAPLLGLALSVVLAGAFMYEARRQNAHLSTLTATEMDAFNQYYTIYTDLIEEHIALYELLYNAGKADEESLYDQAKLHLYKVQDATTALEQALKGKNATPSMNADFSALRNEIREDALTRTRAYLEGVTAALKIATTSLGLAPRQLALAGERFKSMNVSLLKFLEVEGNAMRLETRAAVLHNDADNTAIALIGLLFAVLLLAFSVLLTRLLSRSIETQVKALIELGTQAGTQFSSAGSDQVERMANAIAAFRQSLAERKRHETSIKRLNRVYAVLGQINALIVRVKDRDELFDGACRIAVEAGQFRMCWLGLVDLEAMKIVPVASAGSTPEHMTFIRNEISLAPGTPQGDNLVARAISGRKALFCNDTQNDPGYRFRKEHAKKGTRSVIALPLLVANEAVGVLALYADEAGFFDEEELNLLTGLAGDISFAIDHIEKGKKLGRLTRVQAVMSSINALIVRVRDRDELLAEACRVAVEVGGFTLAWIGIADREAGVLIPTAWAGPGREHIDRLRLAIGGAAPEAHLPAEALRVKGPVISNDVAQDPRVILKDEMAARGMGSLVVLPLIVNEAALGTLTLVAAEVGFFDQDEMKLLIELAGDISFALDHIGQAEKLDYLAYYDELTGLANRSLFLERVAQFMRSAAGSGHKLALFLFDLERFKNINDSLGRPAGDALLKLVAEWLTRHLGDANLFARIDADHFAIVLPEVKKDGDVARLVEKSIKALLDHPFRLNDAVLRIAAKAGVALYPEDGVDADTLFRNAEAALKKAKASGDRYRFYEQKMTDHVAGKLNLENQLREALDKGEFVLHYQPKVNLASGLLTGAEALIRWNDSRTGLVPPGRFIPILEETGLIQDVGRWALRQAIADYLRWRVAGLPAVRIAVNVSPLQLRNRGFMAEVQQAISIDPHAAAGVELEITESLIMEDVKHSISSLTAIRATGVSIAIDDFGTGFSSLSYLARLPVDTLKIDRSFVIDMTVGPEGLALVSTIINLAQSLKLKVVAEGVETQEQSNLLRLLRCDEMQGFLFSKAVPGDIFETKFLAPAPLQVVAVV